MFKAKVEKHTFIFKQASGTSRGILTEKDSWIISLWDSENPEIIGKGEASIIKTLSPEWSDHYESFLSNCAENIHEIIEKDLMDLKKYPSIYFAVEMALNDLKNGGKGIYYPSDFTEKEIGIDINGLIWMGSEDFMLKQISQKIEDGFHCIKMKIGAIDFQTEIEILKSIRRKYSAREIELRVDANGAFQPNEAMSKLDILATLDLHSIEQPIAAGQYDEMKALCAHTPIPIALDEELIGLHGAKEKQHLLEYIQPQYIILKPSLIGGFKGSDEWISAAETNNIKWWITSALEGNIGLDAIAQYTYTKENPLPQGLGTGQLFTNNFESPLYIKAGKLFRNLA
ncbi:MAG: o-succinylbenzoate synthase [Flavobacteriales bacterium]|nr:o-succinylbenzoate synthase [Flavobacteriales bacterium]